MGPAASVSSDSDSFPLSATAAGGGLSLEAGCCDVRANEAQEVTECRLAWLVNSVDGIPSGMLFLYRLVSIIKLELHQDYGHRPSR